MHTKREKMAFQILQRPPDPGEAAGSRADLGEGLLRGAAGSASKPAPRDRPRAWRVRFPRDALRPGSRAPRPGSPAPHEPAAPPTSNPFQFSRSPLNSHKTRKNGFPNPSTAAGPGRRGGIAGRSGRGAAPGRRWFRVEARSPGSSSGLAGPFPSGRPSSGVSRAPARILRAPHEPAAPPTSNPFQFSRRPLNAHKTRKNGFPNPSTAAGPGRGGGIAGR